MSQNRYNKYRDQYGGAAKNISDFYPQTYFCQQPIYPVQTIQYVPISVPATISTNIMYPNNVMISNNYRMIGQPVVPQRCFIFNPYTGRYELP